MRNILNLSAVLLCLLPVLGCSSNKAPAVLHPAATGVPTTPRAAAETPGPEDSDSRPVDVWLIPLEGFSHDLLSQLEQRLTSDTGLKIRSTVEAGRSHVMYFPDHKQMKAESIITEMQPVKSRLYDLTPKTCFIILTDEDINISDRSLRFVFASTLVSHRTAVISTARMQIDHPSTGLVQTRLYKMTKKAIGTMYYGHSRSVDLKSVMYSPVMGLDDLDAVGTDY